MQRRGSLSSGDRTRACLSTDGGYEIGAVAKEIGACLAEVDACTEELYTRIIL